MARRLPLTDDETCRQVLGYEGVYEVSDLGSVRSLDRWILRGGVRHRIRGQPRRPRICELGAQVMLTQNDERENVMVSHLVWQAFRGAMPPDMVIVHNDKDVLSCQSRGYTSNISAAEMPVFFDGKAGQKTRRTREKPMFLRRKPLKNGQKQRKSQCF